MKSYNQAIAKKQQGQHQDINCFSIDGENIDTSVVESFGEEWGKFDSFDQAELDQIANDYFDILDDTIINKDTYAADIGCGSGRWSKCVLDRVKFMEAIDPSSAIYIAEKMLGENDNIRFSQSSTDNIPFDDETFDFAMSIGVLHHIPNTPMAMRDCVKKVKVGGHFYTYLYYALDNKGVAFRTLFKIADGVRKVTSKLPSGIKRLMCDIIAIVFYMPFVLIGRLVSGLGAKKLAESIPLSYYQNTSFHIIRNDALDRFGTKLEQRFTREQVIDMMQQAGLTDIKVSDKMPYWHAVGKRVS